MGDEVGDFTAEELDITPSPLVNAVIHRGGFQAIGYRFEPGQMLGRQKIGDQKIALDLNLANALARSQRGPVAVIDTWSRHIASCIASLHLQVFQKLPYHLSFTFLAQEV